MIQERRRYVFRGYVQGVGFRATAAGAARRLDLAGSVRNQQDGSVELVAQGDPAAIDRLIDALKDSFGGQIRAIDCTPEPADPHLSGFVIRH
jgi:acylphosphatase